MPEINLLPDQVALTFAAGQNVEFDITVTDHLGNPANLSQAAAGMGRTATVAASARPAPAFNVSTSGNVATIRLDPTLSSRAQSGFWEMRASAGGQPVQALVSGTVTVRR